LEKTILFVLKTQMSKYNLILIRNRIKITFFSLIFTFIILELLLEEKRKLRIIQKTSLS
jgi:hypothetical protein